MHVAKLVLEDFRNYQRAEVELVPGLNLVVGQNAQGKTNLLEGIYCLSGLGSPRSHDAAIVRSGAERALVHGDIVRGTRALTVDMEVRPGRGTRALVNKTPLPATRTLAEVAVSVFFGPDELSLVKGSPDGRRRFLDDLVVKLRPARLSLRREWDKVLRQRNALLKSAPPRPPASITATLEVWDEALCRTGAALAAARLHALGSLLPYARKRYDAIAGAGALDLQYASSWLGDHLGAAALKAPGTIDEAAIREVLCAQLAEQRARELERGVSLVGPQRDDVVVRLAASPPGPAVEMLDARAFASQGDQRTSALALKLAEYDLLSEVLGEEPVLLLDDVFSELDPSRRSWLADSVRSLGQVVLTSAEPGAAEAAQANRVIEVVAGRVAVRG